VHGTQDTLRNSSIPFLAFPLTIRSSIPLRGEKHAGFQFVHIDQTIGKQIPRRSQCLSGGQGKGSNNVTARTKVIRKDRTKQGKFSNFSLPAKVGNALSGDTDAYSFAHHSTSVWGIFMVDQSD
jgi:hypothetical protein